MIDEETDGILKIADIHAARLQEALDDLARKYPFDKNFIEHMEKIDLLTLEMMTNRFAKLQDLLGKKVIDLFLQNQAQPVDGLFMLDKIHLLEKFNIIESDEVWDQLRETRNHITHEYPDNPDLAARHLNGIFAMSQKLIAIYQKLAAAIRQG